MKCADVRVELSARMDGEAPDHDRGVEAHLARCGSCRRWVEAAEDITRRVRVAPAPRPVDVVGSVLARVGSPTRARRRSVVRVCVAVVGVVQLALTLAPLVAYPHELHVAHEVSAWDLAFGLALLVAAASPRRAGGLIPLVAALVALMVVLTALDVVADRAAVADEGSHLVVGVSLLLLWLLDRSVSGPTNPLSRGRAPAPEQPGPAGSVSREAAAVRKITPRSRRITGAA